MNQLPQRNPVRRFPHVEPMPLEPLMETDLVSEVQEDYGILEHSLLDNGTFSQVYKIKTQVGRLVLHTALKVVPAEESSNKYCKVLLKEAENEVKILKELHHPCIVILFRNPVEFRTYKSPLNPYHPAYVTMHFELLWKKLETVLMEKQTDGTLASTPMYSTFFRQIASALAYIHREHVVHHDISLSNIMVVKDVEPAHYHFKIIDFGCAKKYPRGVYTETKDLGDPLFMSPQKLDRRQGLVVDYDPFKADVYAFGLVAMKFAVGLGTQPMNNAALFAGRARWIGEFACEGLLRHVPDQMQTAMESMLVDRDHNRFRMDMVLELIADLL